MFAIMAAKFCPMFLRFLFSRFESFSGLTSLMCFVQSLPEAEVVAREGPRGV